MDNWLRGWWSLFNSEGFGFACAFACVAIALGAAVLVGFKVAARLEGGE